MDSNISGSMGISEEVQMVSYATITRTSGRPNWNQDQINLYYTARNALVAIINRSQRDIRAYDINLAINFLNQNHTHNVYDQINSYSGTYTNKATDGWRY